MLHVKKGMSSLLKNSILYSRFLFVLMIHSFFFSSYIQLNLFFCGKTTLRLFFKFLEESVDAGISLFPSIRDSFILNELKVKQMERALENSLDDEERMIIEKKYLAASQTKDIHIYMELGMKKDTYYEIKQRAILRIATALGII